MGDQTVIRSIQLVLYFQLPQIQQDITKNYNFMLEIYIWDCYSSHTSTRPCPPTFGEKQRLQHSTCTLWIRSTFVLGVWTWCLEQSASSAERHRCCLNLQTSLKVWTLLSSLRRFDDCFNRCWSLRLFALLKFFFIDDMCFLHF